ncbi:BlaI/MecI/CopY family transcriptional regulator [Candidatus Woesearchaeota archaeon]|nr:BlaI/MecI/CopY family transcriptional regulator [Candidatus Woesearchaeota archaeon]
MKETVTDFDSLLSPLEQEVLQVLWPAKSMRVREIHSKLKKKVALSSVAVILDRLFDKQIVTRTIETARGGARYIYTPVHDRKAFEKSVVESAVNKLIDTFGDNALSYFNERFKR